MPSYKVLEPGFFSGWLYDPKGKRPVLHTDKPFPSEGDKEQVPSWLEPIKAEKPTQKKKRQVAAKANADQVKADKSLINEATFMGEATSAVETL